MSRYDLTDFEWRLIEPLLPNKPRGVPRVDDRRVLNGIFWVLRSGAPWRDLPERYGPRTTSYNRFVLWRKAGVWGRMMDAITAAYDGDIQMIDTTSIRAHQQAATAKRGDRDHCLGRSRGGLTTKIHAVVDAQGLPIRRSQQRAGTVRSYLAHRRSGRRRRRIGGCHRPRATRAGPLARRSVCDDGSPPG
jgi:transposase